MREFSPNRTRQQSDLSKQISERIQYQQNKPIKRSKQGKQCKT